MRAVVQRVTSARVTVAGEVTGQIGAGLLVLLGIAGDDTRQDLVWLAEKVAGLRIFEDAAGKMNLSVQETEGSVLVVSQFTLYGDCRKGKRPSFIEAAPPERAEPLYQEFIAELKGRGLAVETGRFQAQMEVSLVNHGPVTMLLESRKTF